MDTIHSWVTRYQRLALLTALTLERARFDTQRLLTPEITGIAYQQGTLAGYEVREYLLEKWGRHCAYCDKTNVRLQVDHLTPTSRGGPMGWRT